MKIGKLIYDDESGEARVKFNKKFVYDMYGYEQLDVIKDLQKCLDGWYKSILEDEMMEACFNENNIYDHYYKPNQLVAYNNLTTCHRRMPSPDGIRRRHLRYAAT